MAAMQHDIRFSRYAYLYLALLCCFSLLSFPTFTRAGSIEAPNLPPCTRTVRLPLVQGEELQFKRVNSAGLSQSRVAQILQDDRGFIWFGTQNGLNRYDGYEYKVFKHDPENPSSLSGVYIYSLFKDRSGTLWVGSDEFLDRFDPVTESFTHYRLEARTSSESAAMNITHISQDANGDLWLATRNGLYRFDPATARVHRYQHDRSDPSSIGDNDIKMTGEDRSGVFWVANSESLDRFDRTSGKVLSHLFLGESGIGVSFHEDHSGVFWIIYGATGQLAVLNRETNQFTGYMLQTDKPASAVSGPFYTMLEDRQGTMWFGTGDHGLVKFDRAQQKFISYSMRPEDPESLADTRVIALFQDREGNIWTGLHQSPPNFFDPSPPVFRKFTFRPGSAESLGSSLVSVIYEDHEGVLWIGADRIIKRFAREKQRSTIFPLIKGHEVLSMVEQNGDNIWFATAGTGLKHYNRRTGTLVTFIHNPSDPSSLCSDFIEKLFLDRNGAVWTATWDGLSRFDPQTRRFSTFKPDNSRGLNYHAISGSRDGAIWLGSNLGLKRFDPATGRFKSYEHKAEEAASLSDNRVNSVYQAQGGTLWVGTQNGLDRLHFDSGRFDHFTERSGIGGNVVSCILEDDRARLWMSTNQGLSNFDPVTRKFKNYTVADGLPGSDLSGWGACSKSTSGEMFFGGFSGAVAFYPEKVTDSSYVPPVALTDFRLFGTSVDLKAGSPLSKSITHTSTINLSHAQNIFSIEFSALSYFNASTNRYRYKLEGLQSNWSEVGSGQRTATYTTLPAGSYTFHLQGATSRGMWSEPGTALQIQILPPVWKTGWFQMICAALVSFFLWMLYRARLRHIHAQYDVRLNERVRERSRIARELHDTLLQSFQGLILRFQAAQNMLPEQPIDARKSLEIAIDRAAKAITEGRDAVQDLRKANQGQADFIQSLTVAGRELAATTLPFRDKESATDFRVLVEGDPRRLQPGLGEELYRIGREALSNAFRHARASSIELEVRYSNRMLRLRVRDDGIGIDPNLVVRGSRQGHWGLPGMRERARTIGGRLELWSELSRGTEIELTLPAAFAYLSSGKRTVKTIDEEKTCMR